MAKVLHSTTLPRKKQSSLKCFLEPSKCRVSPIWALLGTIHRICGTCDRPAVCLDLKNLKKKQKSKEKLTPQCNCDRSWLFFFLNQYTLTFTKVIGVFFYYCVLFYILSWEHFFRKLDLKICGYIFITLRQILYRNRTFKNNNNNR